MIEPQPFSELAEKSLIGSFLKKPETVALLAHEVRSDHFYQQSLSEIYKAIWELNNRGDGIDVTTVAEELNNRGLYDEGAGFNLSFLIDLREMAQNPDNAETYASTVMADSQRRRVLEASEKLQSLALRRDMSPTELVSAMQAAIVEAVDPRMDNRFLSMEEMVELWRTRMQDMINHPGEFMGVPTGFSDIDNTMFGLHPEALVIVAARPGSGKTAFLLNIMRNAATNPEKHFRVAMFSLEMGRQELLDRIVASETRVASYHLRRPVTMPEYDRERVHMGLDRLGALPIYVNDSPRTTIGGIRAQCHRLHQREPLDLIVIDYLQLIQPNTRGRNRVDEIAEISGGLKQLARELKVPVLTAAQLNRKVEDRSSHKPMLQDLREGGCLTGDTPVYLPDSGTYKTMGQLVNTADFRVLALNERTWKLEPAVVTKAFSTGKKAVMRLTTRLGKTIRATSNHKFLAFDGWRALGDLCVGESIALPRTLGGPAARTMTDSELALLGHLIGDGCTLERRTPFYTTGDRELAGLVGNLAVDVFGDKVRCRIRQEANYFNTFIAGTQPVTHGVHNPVVAWLTDLGCFNLRSYQKFVPDRVFEQSAEGIATFLRHLWVTDGTMTLPNGGHPNVSYSSSSERLSRNVQSLLLRVGICSVLRRTAQRAKGRDVWSVHVQGKVDLQRFLSAVGGVGLLREERAKEISLYLSGRVSNPNVDTIPKQAWHQYVVPAMQTRGMTTRRMQSDLGMRYSGTSLYKSALSRNRAQRVADVVGSDELYRLATSEVYWDEIVSIEQDGFEEVYDLTVTEHHNFVAADVIVHNSLEQDPDVVMFLYREEMYAPTPDNENLATIDIAKHRAGPTRDGIKLRFDKATTTFQNFMTTEPARYEIGESGQRKALHDAGQQDFEDFNLGIDDEGAA